MNKAGLELVKQWEGFRSDAYKCPANVWTIGYGHTKDVKKGDKITMPQAESLLKIELGQFEKGVKSALKALLNENQLSALVSFAYNVGLGNFGKSTLLKKVNAGDFEGASKEFLKWNKAKGQVLPGLTRRRQDEMKLFLTPTKG